MAGKEVVQLYVSDKTNAVMRPVNELKKLCESRITATGRKDCDNGT